jgi:hypothetical protein
MTFMFTMVMVIIIIIIIIINANVVWTDVDVFGARNILLSRLL